ncbi:MAG: hypothetical protein MRERV_65c003 [Mycoplasmataceae bacterium RV_VA103A]|nr:MAG: hypothetical protein MRERV_65c003 [Mycoplasmataceae bacterium RV_VA103A]
MTHTYINKNGIPIYAEQKNIQTDLQAQDILKTKTPIPDNFLKLTSKERNYTCSTQGWKEPNCERFVFTYEGEWIQLDIPHTIMKELDLPLEENIPHSVYISPQILERKPICGGITIENKKEIIIDEPFSKDQECQTNLTGQQILNQINQLQQEDQLNQQTILNLQNEVAELENKLSEIEKLKNIWRNKFLEAKGDQNQELQGQITTLVGEKDNIQQELDNRQAEIRRLNNALQTAQQEKERIERDLKSNLLGLLFKNKQKNKRISELNSSLSFLRGLLADKNQEVNDLEQRLIATDTLITNTQNLLGIDDLNNLATLLSGETLNGLLERPTQAELQAKQSEINEKDEKITQLTELKNNLEREKEKLQQELNIEKGWWDKWINSSLAVYHLPNIQPKVEQIFQRRGVKEGNYLRFDIGMYSTLQNWNFHEDRKTFWEGGVSDPNVAKAGKEVFKLIYEYYKNQP